MPRLSATPVRALHRSARLHVRPSFAAQFASTDANEKGTQNSRPGWSGRPAEDHATQRDRLDTQGDASQEGMKKFQDGQDQNTKTASGQAITRKDEKNANQRAKDDHPEAPGPVIGMNDERGSVSAFKSMMGTMYADVPFCRKAIEVGFEESGIDKIHWDNPRGTFV
jgi:hypothetical protein